MESTAGWSGRHCLFSSKKDKLYDDELGLVVQHSILVTKKSLKYKYARFGSVVTRNTFRETIRSIFAPT